MDTSRSGKLEVSLVVLEDDIKLHLNSAQASLDSQQVKYARNGLLSAAIVSAYAKLALTHAVFASNLEHNRFHEYLEMATKLITAYWEDFGLVFLHGPQADVVAKVAKNRPDCIRQPMAKKRKKQVFLTPDQRVEIKALWTERPAGVTMEQWAKEIAGQFGCSYWTVREIGQDYHRPR